jgi:hypothetical protein
VEPPFELMYTHWPFAAVLVDMAITVELPFATATASMADVLPGTFEDDADHD